MRSRLPLFRPPILPTHRKKVTGIRRWLLLDSAGRAQVVEAGKHAIMRRTGLPARELRILDGQLGYPSTIMGREDAIVVNLEQIKAAITAKEVLLLNSDDPTVTPVVEELQRRLVRHYKAATTQEGNAEESRSSKSSGKEFIEDVSRFKSLDEAGKENWKPSVENRVRVGLDVLPFEFVALEAFLEATCASLETEAKTLEQEARPALDKLTSNTSTLNLEHVRQLKSRLVSITSRVQKVQDELEHLLDNDEDMAEMCLTEKQRLENSSTSSLNDRVEMDGKYLRGVEEIEMLLEAYFVQIDGTLNKLSTLREYVNDTEDYINIMLDDKQNHLLQMGVMLTTATLVISCFIVVAGIFGRNIRIEMFNDEVEIGMPKFLWTVGGCSIGCAFLYVFAIAWYKHKGVLE